MEVSKYTEVYKGTRGIYVQVTRYGNFGQNQALVRVSNFDHPWSEHIFLCDTVFNGNDMNVSYTTQIDGSDYVLMRTTKEWGAIWLQGNYAFEITYQETVVDHMEGRNDIVNAYHNSHLTGNPRK
jgi:hypothetical protein